MPRLLADTTPLQVSPEYRRLFGANLLGNLGQQLAVVAIGLQVFELTGSTFAVGLVGAFALVPLVLLGLYGGALVDAHDRRRVALVSSALLWVVAVLTALQAWADLGSVEVLYALVAAQSACFAIANPARGAIIPRLVGRELLPAANALSAVSMGIGFTAGPLLGAWLVAGAGYATAYTADAVLYLAVVWAMWRLPALPPDGEVRRAGLGSVLEGFRYLTTRPNVRGTFVVDLCAMVLSFPRALLPAVAAVALVGGSYELRFGLLTAAIAVGTGLAGLLSGPLGHVRRQGLAIVVAVCAWGAAIAAFGLVVVTADALGRAALWLAFAALVGAGAADAVSAAFRQTVLQDATPDALRGRLQGVFIVVVAGGPRLGDVVAGTAGERFGEGLAAVVGGLACIAAVLLFARRQPRFVAYDARSPEP